MVILAAAALGAVGYGTYRAGEEAVREGKKTARNVKLANRVRSHQNDFIDKSKDRQERIAELHAARNLSGGDRVTPQPSTSKNESNNNVNNNNTSLRMQGVMSRLKEDDTKKKSILKNPFGRNKK